MGTQGVCLAEGGHRRGARLRNGPTFAISPFGELPNPVRLTSAIEFFFIIKIFSFVKGFFGPLDNNYSSM
jgi:hypothetical protein